MRIEVQRLGYLTVETRENYSDRNGSKQFCSQQKRLPQKQLVPFSSSEPQCSFVWKGTSRVSIEPLEKERERGEGSETERENEPVARGRILCLFRSTETISAICLSMTMSGAACEFSRFFRPALSRILFLLSFIFTFLPKLAPYQLNGAYPAHIPRLRTGRSSARHDSRLRS